MNFSFKFSLQSRFYFGQIHFPDTPSSPEYKGNHEELDIFPNLKDSQIGNWHIADH